MKAQVSSEFMVVLAALLMVFVVLFTVSFGGSGNLSQIQDSAATARNAQSVAAALNYVYLAGNGASYNFTLSGVHNEENITISGYAVASARRNAYSSAPLLDAEINASSLGRGNILLTNDGGLIHAGSG